MTIALSPDYTGHNIVNLVQSIAQACGASELPYPPCALLSNQPLAEARHIVLLVIDGLGLEMLNDLPETSLLRRHTVGSLTSVFPSTTASAIPTFMSGLAPAQHGLTGWHMYLPEIDHTLAVLPLQPRAAAGAAVMEDAASLPPRLFDYPTLFQRMGRESRVISPARIATSPFNAWHARGAETLAHDGLPELFAVMERALRGARPSYVYAYFPDLDSASHRFGTHSPEARQILAAIDAAFSAFVEAIAGHDAWLLVTADHGFIDSPPARAICLDDHPELAAMLARALTGERRAAYCHVLPERKEAFVAYVVQRFASAIECHASEELIRRGWFGPPPYHPRLSERVGDFTLIMKDDWTIKDWLPGERRHSMLGVHGGISDAEMLVPLIALRV